MTCKSSLTDDGVQTMQETRDSRCGAVLSTAKSIAGWVTSYRRQRGGRYEEGGERMHSTPKTTTRGGREKRDERSEKDIRGR
jgi:hypothetical protein